MSNKTNPAASTIQRITDRSFLLSVAAMAGAWRLIEAGNVPSDKIAVFVLSAFVFTFPEKMKDAAALVAAIRGQAAQQEPAKEGDAA